MVGNFLPLKTSFSISLHIPNSTSCNLGFIFTIEFQVSTMNLSSTLVETVSIDYEDFNESFLTCGTCLNTFDSSLQTPKLLPCSHTICLECLTRIVATFARDSQFRCPICR